MSEEATLANTVYIIRGLPGSGKSTFAQMLLECGVIEGYFEADQYFMKDGEYCFDASKLGEAHADCLASVEKYLSVEQEYPYSIAVSNTGTTEKEIKPYIELAEKYGFNVVSLIVENRHGNKSIHNVPEATLAKMSNRFSVKLS